jgi:hypothetical protein
MGKNVLKSSPLKPVSQYSKHVIDGPSMLKLCLLMAAILDGGRGHRTQF